MKLLLLFVLFIDPHPVKYITSFSNPDLIVYTPGIKIKGSDFKADFPSKRLAPAYINSGINLSYYGYGIDISCVMTKSDSYIVDANEMNYLNHEQRHFDISYFYTMKLIKELKRTKVFEFKDVGELSEKINKELDSFQDRYDRDVRLFMNNDKQGLSQEKWNIRIDSMLATVIAKKMK